ncbi:SDR family oxidoreductase [Psychromicrobium sp. YIM B11713]|uniref:SDR family oxidoreductase n=1 Tax=Psychromicrobium sp. YIM B11713 TaxID=3145233 RepID=UPI00374E47EF
MLIAIAGGTGTAGRAVVAEALSRGHQVRVISRHRPEALLPGVSHAIADANDGGGLVDAVAGTDALIDTLDAKFGKALRALPAASGRLREAAVQAGMSRTVLLSILNCEQSDYGYYRAQAARAALYSDPRQPGSVVYATQFHNLIGSILGALPGVIPVFSGVSFQPISVESVARALVDAAESGAAETRVAGPEVLSMAELSEQWKAAGHRGARLKMPLPGAFGEFLRAGKNLELGSTVPGERFAEWAARSGAGH